MEEMLQLVFILGFLAATIDFGFADDRKFQAALDLGSNLLLSLKEVYSECVTTNMPSQSFVIDNLQGFVNSPSKTTVGYAPRYTGNRKFFANMMTSTAFKQMVAKDEDEIRKSFVAKMKFCDQAINDIEFLKEFYDKDFDQSKI